MKAVRHTRIFHESELEARENIHAFAKVEMRFHIDFRCLVYQQNQQRDECDFLQSSSKIFKNSCLKKHKFHGIFR